MNIDFRVEGNIAIAGVSGEIDSKTAPEAQTKLLGIAADHSRLVIDMTNVTFLSSAGLRTLLLLYRQTAARNGKIVLVGLSEEIKDTMSMTGFLKFFAVAGTPEEGLKALS